jgi:hypothetical protein
MAAAYIYCMYEVCGGGDESRCEQADGEELEGWMAIVKR